MTGTGRTTSDRDGFAFCNAGDPLVYIGSADMMHRNLDRRVETLVRITDPQQAAALVRQIGFETGEGFLEAFSHWLEHHRQEAGVGLVGRGVVRLVRRPVPEGLGQYVTHGSSAIVHAADDEDLVGVAFDAAIFTSI